MGAADYLRAHLSLVLAFTVGLAGVTAGLILPPGGAALAWFIPLVDGATVLSLMVAASMAGIDVIVRHERSALAFVAIGGIVAPLWLAHLLSFTGMLQPLGITDRDGELLLDIGRLAMPLLLIWVLLQPSGSLSNPRRTVSILAAIAFGAAAAVVATSVALGPTFQSLTLAKHFTGVNTALLVMESASLAVVVCLFALGRRGDSRFETALTGAIVLLAFQAIVEFLSKSPFDAAWYAASALRLDPPLLLMAGLLSLYGPSVRALQVAESRHRMLEEVDAHLKLTVEMSPVAVISTDEAGTITGWNPRAEAIFGWLASEAIGQPLWTLVAAADWQKSLRRRVRRLGKARLRQPAQVMGLTGIHRAGRALPIELILAARQGPGANAILVCLVRQLTAPDGDVLPAAVRVAVTEPFISSATWAEAAPRVLQGICEELDLELGEFWTVDRAADVLRLEHGWHRRIAGFDRFTTLRRDLKVVRGKGLLGRVWKTGMPYWSSDLPRDPNTAPGELVPDFRLRSGGAFTIRDGAEIVGVLGLFTRRRVRLDRFRLERLDQLASDLGGLIEQKRSDEAMRASSQRIRAVLEQTELIHPLTAWVLNEALRQAHAWHVAGIDLPVAVNLSGRNLVDPELPDTIRGLLQTWSLAPETLILEITERTTLATQDFESLRLLHALGVRLAIDDFGMGYSSLTYLRNLPLYEVKIDSSFVTDMVGSQDDLAIVRSTIDLGHSMGLRVVAEGVNSVETAEALARLRCDYLQGFFIARPMAGAEIAGWVQGLKNRLGNGRKKNETT